jgi:hypothetical protein
MTKENEDEKRQMALQVRDTRVFAFMDQLEKAEKFPVEIRSGIVSMLNEKIKYVMDWETAEMISSSDLVPKDYVGKPNNVFLAIQTGRSLGLDPFQSVKHLYTVNGRTSLFGDMMLGLAKGHDEYDDIIEVFGEMVDAGKDHGQLPSYARCTIKRKGKTDVVREYTLDDAKHNPNFNKFNKNFQTNQWTEPGTWMRNGKRMMQMRARSFALRDSFPDKLSGVYDEYEIQEIAESKDITDQTTDLNQQSGTGGLKDSLKTKDEETVATEPTNVEIQDGKGNVIKTEEPKPEPVVQEKPENIEDIKADFKKWKKAKQISAKEYKAFGEAGSSGSWDAVVEIHRRFTENIVVEPVGEYALKLSKIVDLEEYQEALGSLISDESVELISNDGQLGELLRTKDEKLAKEIFTLLESRKDQIDSAAKDEAH